jgi:hypothetical protein
MQEPSPGWTERETTNGKQETGNGREKQETKFQNGRR